MASMSNCGTHIFKATCQVTLPTNSFGGYHLDAEILEFGDFLSQSRIL